jgi:2-methylisocitrate lyase-like PEP mutase family enzyme
MSSPGSQLKELMRSHRPVVAPGVFDPMTAKIFAAEGFSALYAGGSAISVMMYGRPDLGLTSLSERVSAVDRITEASELPLMVDADTGFGGPLTLRLCVKQFEHAGAAGLHIEDEADKSTHDFGSNAAPLEVMVDRIQIALDARNDPDFQIFARCNTLRSHGSEETLSRAHAYIDAGADGLFVLGTSPDEVETVAREFPDIPLLYNMSVRGDGPKVTVARLSELGFGLVIVPNLFTLAALRAIQETGRELLAKGSIAHLLDQIANPEEWEEISGFNAAEDFQNAHRH